MNFLWSACSNDGSYSVLENPIGRILFDIINYQETFMQKFFNDVLKDTKCSQAKIEILNWLEDCLRDLQTADKKYLRVQLEFFKNMIEKHL